MVITFINSVNCSVVGNWCKKIRMRQEHVYVMPVPSSMCESKIPIMKTNIGYVFLS
jgi:hypothetical protein